MRFYQVAAIAALLNVCTQEFAVTQALSLGEHEASNLIEEQLRKHTLRRQQSPLAAAFKDETKAAAKDGDEPATKGFLKGLLKDLRDEVLDKVDDAVKKSVDDAVKKMKDAQKADAEDSASDDEAGPKKAPKDKAPKADKKEEPAKKEEPVSEKKPVKPEASKVIPMEKNPKAGEPLKAKEEKRYLRQSLSSKICLQSLVDAVTPNVGAVSRLKPQITKISYKMINPTTSTAMSPSRAHDPSFYLAFSPPTPVST